MLREILDRRSILYTLNCFTCVEDLTKAMNNPNPFDLIFLDIILGDVNGVDFARQLRKNGQDVDIIFITVSSNYAVDSYEVAPIHYLIKPVVREKLEQAVNRALNRAIPKRIAIRTPKGILAANLNELVFIEVHDHTISIHKADGTQDTYCGALSGLENQLPPLQFIRSHKSYLVNMACITDIMRYEVTLCGNVKLPIGKKRYNDVQNSFIEYASQKNPAVL